MVLLVPDAETGFLKRGLKSKGMLGITFNCTVVELRRAGCKLSARGHFVRVFSLPRHTKCPFLVQKCTSILHHLSLFSHLHSFTGTIGIFLC